jgi:hypothetical protein
MNTDTPKTDAVVKGEWIKYEKLCRELERENARMRGLLREAGAALDTRLLAAWCSDLEGRIAAEVGSTA